MAARRLLRPPTFPRPKPSPIRRVSGGGDPVAPAWPSYTGTSEYVGTSADGRVTVYVDPSLAGPGLQNAQDLVSDGARVVALNDQLFGTGDGKVSVIVFALGGMTDGTGGADHMGCDYQSGAAIEVCASFGNSARVSALLEAELSECAMGNNLCGLSTGEALSRWCAAFVSLSALADFATAPFWASRAAMANFVDLTDPSDQNPDSTGCGMAFLSWLQSLGCSLSAIAVGMVALGDGGTLAALYAQLSGDDASSAWPKFSAAIQALPWGVTDDDPFAHVAPPGPPAPPPAPPAPAPAPPPAVALTLAEAQQAVSDALAAIWPSS